MTATPSTIAHTVRPIAVAKVTTIAERIDDDTRRRLAAVATLDSHELTHNAYDSLMASV